MHRTNRTSRTGRPAGVACLLLLLAACAAPDPSTSVSPASASPRPSASDSAPASASQVPATTPSASPTPAVPAGSGPDRLRVEPFVSGLADPIGLTNAGDGSGRLFVNERNGRIRIVTGDGELLDRPFVDLSDRVLGGGERGLLGVAFHPDFARNGRLFVHYTRAGDGYAVVSELRASDDRSAADAGSERVLLTFADPYSNHNGGQLAFGPDGYLYIGLGDGGGGGDPLRNGQNTDVLLGKILRIDVNSEPSGGRAYAIPADNPFAPGGVRPGDGAAEVWAYGLRNPWRFSFDSATGDLYIGDVGQELWEEIDRQPASSVGGENYGWNLTEGAHCFLDDCDPAAYIAPIAEYSHDVGSCSVTGGYVYRGPAQPELQGIYVFGDFCSGIIFTLNPGADTGAAKQVLASGLRLASFGVDEADELYAVDIAGSIYRVLVAS